MSDTKRPWHRLHRSTWVVAGLVMVCLVLLEAPGEFISAEEFFSETNQLDMYDLNGRVLRWHGWPMVYRSHWSRVDRYSANVDIPQPPWLVWEAWNWGFGEGRFMPDATAWFSFGALFVDLAVATAILFGVTCAFEARRRHRHHIWQIGLNDLVYSVLAVAVVFGYWKSHEVRWTGEQQALRKLWEFHLESPWPAAGHSHSQRANVSVLHKSDSKSRFVGPKWFLKLVGRGGIRREFESIDAIFWYISRHRFSEQIVNVKALPNLRELVVAELTNDELHRLSELRQIEDLQLIYRQPERCDTGLKTIAGMSNLHRLTIYGPAVSDEGIAHLYNAKHLQSIDLIETLVTPQGVAELRRHLPDCNICSIDVVNDKNPAMP